MKKTVRVRYAPSPTGYLHLGNARTVIFNYLFAKHFKGKFIVRTENTDLKRNISGALKSQIKDIEWIGVKIDESEIHGGSYGPYNQLERLPIYEKYVQTLLEEGIIYHCFCTIEDIEKMRQLQQKNSKNLFFKYNRHCLNLPIEEKNKLLKNNTPYNLRFRVPDNQIYEFDDLIRGKVSFRSEDISDWIVVKSNSIPTYNFAVTIDDILMKITHVIRGQEHISNTPLQLMLYDALKQPWPTFVHLTLIVDDDNKKMSKRSSNYNFFISSYRKKGYLPQAIFNFLALLGWTPKIEEEIFTQEDLIIYFDEHKWSSSNSNFDINKLNWMNNYYIKALNNNDYYNFIIPFLEKKYNLDDHSKEWFKTLTFIYKKELNCGEDIIELTRPFFYFSKKISPATKQEWKSLIINPKFKVKLINKISKIKNWRIDSCQKVIEEIKNELNLKGKNLFMPIRILVTWSHKGPQLASAMYLIGKDEILKRISEFYV